MLKIFCGALLSGAALAVISSVAFAADLDSGEGGMKNNAPAPDHAITVNGGVTSDYASRGISNSDNDPAIFTGVDLAIRQFYVGAWGSSVNQDVSDGGLELDLYAGWKPTYRNIELDFGFIYYAYPNPGDRDYDLNYYELKAAASAKVIDDLTLTGTVWWTPNNTGESGSTWTLEGKASKPLALAELTLSGALGYVTSADTGGRFSCSFGDDNYTYWNVGLSRTFREHYTLDVRYWGADVDVPASWDDSRHLNALADDRVVGTFTFNY